MDQHCTSNTLKHINCNIELVGQPFGQSFKSYRSHYSIDIELQVGLNITTYIVEPQASHQFMATREIETPLIEHDLDSDHTPIFDYL
jgi:hypothetical protein